MQLLAAVTAQNKLTKGKIFITFYWQCKPKEELRDI